MVQPTSPHLPKHQGFSFFHSSPPSSLARSFLSLFFRCRRMLPALHFGESLSHSTRPHPPPPAGSKWESRQPPSSVQKRLQFHFSAAAQGQCFLHAPYACLDADIAAPHSSRGSPAISLQGRRGRILVRIRRPCRATSYASAAPQDSAAAAQRGRPAASWSPPPLWLWMSLGALKAPRESGGAGARPKCPASRRPTARRRARLSSHFSSLYHIIRKSASRPRRRTRNVGATDNIECGSSVERTTAITCQCACRSLKRLPEGVRCWSPLATRTDPG